MSIVERFLADPYLLLNAVGEGIYGFDLQGNAVFINPAAEQMTGWQNDELLGQNIHQYHHHSHADGTPYPACDCKIYATLKDGKVRKVNDEVFWRKDGSSFPVEYTTAPVYREDELIGAVAIFRDVSSQRQTESALRTALADNQQLTQQLQAENTYLQSEIQQEWLETGLVGKSLVFQQMLEQLDLVAKTDSTVLILGENGTGKELIARNIHNRSLRQQSTMVRVNCAAFSANLLESELFGHEKGAFTGATETRKGRFELANNGTLFLDEIGELSLSAQSKLLRVIQEQEFERVGGSKTIKVNIRLITATNKDLAAMVERGEFRMDLYYRLNVFPIKAPALRDRIEDLPLIAEVIINKLNQKLGKNIQAINNKSLVKLSQYQWPGNIRELQNILEREVILAKGAVLDIKQSLAKQSSGNRASAITLLAEAEKHHIISVLKQCRWRIGGVQGAAKLLGLPDSTLRSKMKKLNIERPV